MADCCKHYGHCESGWCDCGGECSGSYYPTPGEPCWGPVVVVGEDYDEDAPELTSWVHACTGHRDLYGYSAYPAYVREPSCADHPAAPER